MRDRWPVVVAAAALAFAAAIGAVAVGSDPPDADPRGGVSDNTDDVSAVHDAGVTGDGVDVGVVDVTQFDVASDALADRVAGARSFGDGGVWTRGETTHGTAAAAVVTSVAPDANLYLASVSDGESFARAVRWLVEAGADVVVTPVAAYGKPDDASGRFARAAAWAAERGAVVVAPTGNLGRSHWTGRHDGGAVSFGGDTRNYLVGDGDRASLWLSWPRNATSDSYAVELYGESGNETWLVARSTPYERDSAPNAHLAARVNPAADHFVVVRGPSAPTKTRLSLSSSTHVLEHGQRRGSVAAPAVAESVVSVGAYDSETAVSTPYSGAGTLSDGRRGVDILGPERVDAAGVPASFEGTSAAAAYVAGVATLVTDAAPALPASRVEALLAEYATDAGVAGVDPLAGHGRVRPVAAVRAARNASA
jgi:hypothetical protein